MSIDRHFATRGIQLTDDNSLPVGQRAQRNVKRVIAAVRAAEAEFNDELREADRKCRSAQEEVIVLQRRLSSVEKELNNLKLAKKLDDIQSLTTADRHLLLNDDQA